MNGVFQSGGLGYNGVRVGCTWLGLGAIMAEPVVFKNGVFKNGGISMDFNRPTFSSKRARLKSVSAEGGVA